MRIKKKIGEVLIEAGLITATQLETALAAQKGKNKRLGKVLIELGYVNEVQVAAALSKQLSIPLIDCESFTLEANLLALVPKSIAEKYIVLPLELEKANLHLAMADPLDWKTIDGIAFKTGLKISVAVAPESNIVTAIEKYYGEKEKVWDLLREIPAYEGAEFIKDMAKAKDAVNAESLYRLSEAPPIVKLVTMVVVDAMKSRASDIHIEPQENHVQVRFRVDGELRNALRYPKHIQDSVISRVKIISNLDITNRRAPQDGRSTLRFSDKSIDLRISTLPSVYGENIVIRLLDPTTGLMPLSRLGVPEAMLKSLLELCGQPQGMVLVTGPTGSGKTTTLYAILQQLRTETESIFSIEDPVEYTVSGITQVAVNDAVGLTFAAALRSILRQDPDIIMVGEIRDIETAEIAVRAALTGHLLLSTLHTNDTVASITRLYDLGLDPYLISSSITGILAQRLVRTICPNCKAETTPPDAVKSALPPLKVYFKGQGCNECMQSGFRGQIGVYEFLPMTTRLKRLVAKRANDDELWEAAREAGVKTLFENAWQKVEEGLTTVEEVIAKIPKPKGL